jgi:hypothetical protein
MIVADFKVQSLHLLAGLGISMTNCCDSISRVENRSGFSQTQCRNDNQDTRENKSYEHIQILTGAKLQSYSQADKTAGFM